jgi:hypothetical protein
MTPFQTGGDLSKCEEHVPWFLLVGIWKRTVVATLIKLDWTNFQPLVKDREIPASWRLNQPSKHMLWFPAMRLSMYRTSSKCGKTLPTLSAIEHKCKLTAWLNPIVYISYLLRLEFGTNDCSARLPWYHYGQLFKSNFSSENLENILENPPDPIHEI